jgi:hypothetical protein
VSAAALSTKDTAMTDTRTIDDALGKFRLIAGPGSEQAGEACVMTALAWTAGLPWSDHPECAHPALAELIIRSQDDPSTSEQQRRELLRAGVEGVLDTWWVPTEVIVYAMATAPRDATPFERALHVEWFIAGWKQTKERHNLADAYLADANLADAYLAGANLADAYLAGANLAGAYLAGAYLARANLADAYLAGAYLADANLAGANLAGANLADAYLAGAKGNQYTKLPAGWKVNEAGLIVKANA